MSAHLNTITPIETPDLLPEHTKLRDEVKAERESRIPELLRVSPSARLTRRVGGMTTVAEVLCMLRDGASEFTAADMACLCSLYHEAKRARREAQREGVR